MGNSSSSNSETTTTTTSYHQQQQHHNTRSYYFYVYTRAHTLHVVANVACYGTTQARARAHTFLCSHLLFIHSSVMMSTCVIRFELLLFLLLLVLLRMLLLLRSSRSLLP